MTDYAEERASELEVLESIFPDELTVISPSCVSIRVEPEVQSASEPYTLQLVVTYSERYPDELPEIGITVEQGDLSEEEEETLVMGLIGAANDSIGMAMVYTLSLYLRESLAVLLQDRKERIQAAADEVARVEDEEIAKRTAGTKVTPESFGKWKVAFELELKTAKAKEESDRIRALPPKERDEVRKTLAKASGRQLFETDPNLVLSDMLDDEEGVSVDVSMYERSEALEEAPADRLRLGDMSDSD